MSTTTTYSSTMVKNRQPKQEDVQFSKVLSQIRTTGKAVPIEDIGNVGQWQPVLDEINTAALENQIDATLATLTKSYPRLNVILSMPVESDLEQEQTAAEDLGPDFKIGKSGKQVFTTLSMDDIEQLPDIEYLVAGILQTSTTSMLFGESNTGKTFNALHLALCIAYGLPWLGRPVKQGNVLYIYAEGKLGMKPRIQAWKKHPLLFPVKAATSTQAIQFIAHPVHLTDQRDFILDTVNEQEKPLELVVIDTFSNCAIGTNQNDQMEVARVLSVGHEIARLYGCHVMFVHHTNNSGKVNGSAAFKNHVDTMIELSQADTFSPIFMRCEKQRDTERFKDIVLELEQVEVGFNAITNEPITSCVVIPSTVAAEKGVPPVQQDILDALGPDELTYSEWEKRAEDAGVKKSSFDKSRKTLVNRGIVKRTADQKRYYAHKQEVSSNE